ncbi:MAG: DNA-3-methyladenine glycosylase 2 family protein [Rhodospirillales bacterium]|nr:DNA-3-methyladenine glycosylase 2 family protein [Rhodospirillales bacterium]MDH3917771.1 DNA-3-methyladenine glycosylase 2 family protein [Rhodospirillales bacterium]MDH3970254.1 DNA-3-methyladenine glycosylase 2 family protein [Rhodospirillales bacterium]
MQLQAPPDESLRPALEALAECDADIARAYEVCGLPPERRRPTGFAGLLSIMTAQQVSAQAARAIIGRLLAAADPLTPERFLALDEADFKRIGFSRQKIRYGRALAEDVLAGRIDLEAVARLDDEAGIETLIRVKGVGRWTAEIYLLFALRRPDVWPVDDLAVCAGVQRLKGLAERPSRDRMLEIGEPWRPHRSAAARFLWHFYHHPGVPD